MFFVHLSGLKATEPWINCAQPCWDTTNSEQSAKCETPSDSSEEDGRILKHVKIPKKENPLDRFIIKNLKTKM